jgi:GTP-binding protein HflX
VPIEAFVPYDKGELLNDIHKVGMVERTVSVLFDH